MTLIIVPENYKSDFQGRGMLTVMQHMEWRICLLLLHSSKCRHFLIVIDRMYVSTLPGYVLGAGDAAVTEKDNIPALVELD